MPAANGCKWTGSTLTTATTPYGAACLELVYNRTRRLHMHTVSEGASTAAEAAAAGCCSRRPSAAASTSGEGGGQLECHMCRRRVTCSLSPAHDHCRSCLGLVIVLLLLLLLLLVTLVLLDLLVGLLQVTPGHTRSTPRPAHIQPPTQSPRPGCHGLLRLLHLCLTVCWHCASRPVPSTTPCPHVPVCSLTFLSSASMPFQSTFSVSSLSSL